MLIVWVSEHQSNREFGSMCVQFKFECGYVCVFKDDDARVGVGM